MWQQISRNLGNIDSIIHYFNDHRKPVHGVLKPSRFFERAVAVDRDGLNTGIVAVVRNDCSRGSVKSQEHSIDRRNLVERDRRACSKKVFTFESSEWAAADVGNCFQVIKLTELLPLKVCRVFAGGGGGFKWFTCGEKFREERTSRLGSAAPSFVSRRSSPVTYRGRLPRD